MNILRQMLEAPWVGEHLCEKVKDIEQDLALSCEFCHLQALWHELAREVRIGRTAMPLKRRSVVKITVE